MLIRLVVVMFVVGLGVLALLWFDSWRYKKRLGLAAFFHRQADMAIDIAQQFKDAAPRGAWASVAMAWREAAIRPEERSLWDKAVDLQVATEAKYGQIPTGGN